MFDLNKWLIPLEVEAEVHAIEDAEEYNNVRELILASKVAQKDKSGILKGLKTAAPEPIVDGKPRMLHLTAFIVHEGVNKNGDEFLAEDLQEAVTGRKLFRGAYAGMIDIDHDFSPIGYWYDAEFTNDPATGTDGILAKGAIWAWRFPEVADRILASQQREGTTGVSMACLCKAEDVDFRRDETGRMIATNRNPVFIATTILLDIPEAGDDFARAVADEDPKKMTDKERRDTLLKAASNNSNNNVEDNKMLEDIKPLIESLRESVGENNSQILASINDMFANLMNTLEERDTALEDAEQKNQQLEERISELTTQVEEKDVSLQSAIEERDARAAELEAANEVLAEYKAEEEDRAFEERKQQRLAEVSETIRANLMEKSEEVRNAILARWAEQDEERWEATKAEHSLVSESVRTPSNGSGALPNAGTGNEPASLERFLL